MSIENKETLKIYEKKASTYLATTIKHDKLDPEKAKRKRERLKEFIKKNLEQIPKESKILEIGSADGTNAKYIEELGYQITASDIAEDFLKAIKEKGLKTIKFNALEDNLKEKYYAVFCWRVFVHFTKEDAIKVMQKTYNMLENNGIFIFNAMNRKTKDIDEEWVDFPNEYHMGEKRYYKYFSKHELDEIITKTGYQIHSFNYEGGENNDKWLVYVLKK